MTKTLKILNNSKLYFKFLSELQQTAAPYQSRITIQKGESVADAKVFKEILALLDGEGPHLVVTAEGEDAPAALEAISQLAATNFLKLNTKDYLGD